MSALDETAFPALLIAPDGWIFPYESAEELHISNVRAFRKGVFSGATLVGSNLVRVDIRGATRIGTVPPFWGFRLFYARAIRIRLDLGDPVSVGLSSLKDEFERAMKRAPHMWNSIADESFEDKLAQVRAAPDFLSLYALLAA